MLKSLFIIYLSLISIYGEKVKYTNYSLYKVLPKNFDQLRILQELQNGDSKYDFWSHPKSSLDYVSILSSPDNKDVLESVLNENEINYEIKIRNIQDIIDKEVVRTYSRDKVRMEWSAYYKLDDIYNWLDDLAAVYPSVASIIVGGTSYQGRDIKGIKISHGSGRKAIFIEGGIHSREWISPATINFITNELLTSNDTETQSAARDFDWYIFPVINPDGYVWAHNAERLWRKNRRPYGNSIGVDLNRNWNNNWLKKGASSNPSSNNYAGPGPFSEIESRSLSAYLTTIGDKIDVYLSVHSHGQLLMLPFGNSTEPLANYYDALNIGRRAMGALSVRYGTQYTTGTIAETIRMATGSTADWVKEQLRIPLVYAFELRDRGTYGFLLPADQILPSGEETMDSILEIIHQAKRFGYLKN